MSARVVGMRMQDIEAMLCLDEVEEAGIAVPASVVSRVKQDILCTDRDMKHHCFTKQDKLYMRAEA